MCSMCTVHVQKEKYATFWVKGIHLAVCQNREALSPNIKHGRLLCQKRNRIWYCWVYYCSTSSPSFYEWYPFLPMESLWHLVEKPRGTNQKKIVWALIEMMEQYILNIHLDTMKPHSRLTAKAKGLNLCQDCKWTIPEAPVGEEHMPTLLPWLRGHGDGTTCHGPSVPPAQQECSACSVHEHT